jgi:hypothetical protein
MAKVPASHSGSRGGLLPRDAAQNRGKLGTARLGIAVATVVLLFLAPLVFAQDATSPRVTNVEPATGKVNDSVTLTGTNLGKDSVSAVFLSDDKDDFKAVLVEQAGEKIVLKVPQVKAGGYNISIQLGDRILILPLKFSVQ